MLRIDIASAYEENERIYELLELFDDENFFELFNLNTILTKAIPEATERIRALKRAGYIPFDWDEPNRKAYFAKKKANNI